MGGIWELYKRFTGSIKECCSDCMSRLQEQEHKGRLRKIDMVTKGVYIGDTPIIYSTLPLPALDPLVTTCSF